MHPAEREMGGPENEAFQAMIEGPGGRFQTFRSEKPSTDQLPFDHNRPFRAICLGLIRPAQIQTPHQSATRHAPRQRTMPTTPPQATTDSAAV